MNRTFKFRAYNKIEQKMMSWGVMKEYNDLEYFFENNEDLPLMQFTGLKDKNGKEIYEGDILHSGKVDGINWICIFENGAFLFLRQGFESEGGYGLHAYLGIIGNIYEHAHLLTKASPQSESN